MNKVRSRWRCWILFCTLAAATAAVPTATADSSLTAALMHGAASIVRLHIDWNKGGTLGSTSGIGFVVGGHVLTAAHLIPPLMGFNDDMLIEGVVITRGSQSRRTKRFKVVWWDDSEDIDIAVLRPIGPLDLKGVSLNWDDIPRLTKTVYFRGYSADILDTRRGIISQPVTVTAQTDAILGPDFSGGPVYNATGHVIGITKDGALPRIGDTSTVMGHGRFVVLSLLPKNVRNELRAILKEAPGTVPKTSRK